MHLELWRRGVLGLILAVVAGVAVGSEAGKAAPWEEHGKLRVAPSGRYLEHEDQTPLLWIADTAWALFYKLRREEVVDYFEQRRKQGFNVIQAVAYWYPHGEDGPGPNNAANPYGHRPFEGTVDNPDTARPKLVDGGSPDRPNDYWDHVDFILREARKRGLYLAVLPCWGRAYVNPQMSGPARVEFDPEKARAYGRFLGKRYGGEPQLVWVLGGDANATAGAPGDQRAVYRAMAEGIGEGAIGRKLSWNRKDQGWGELLMTYHPDGAPAYNSSSWFHSDPWLDFNGIETWKSIDAVYETVSRDYARDDPVKPTMLLEGAYEEGNYPSPGDRITAPKVRQQAYHTFFAGGAGHTYGGFPVWDFTRDPKNDTFGHTWRDALDFPGAPQIGTVLRNLLDENRWWTLAPNQAVIQGAPGKGEQRIAAVRSADGDRILVYFPKGRSTEVRLDLAGSSTAQAHWFDPRDGRRVRAGEHPVGSTAAFTPPGGWEDAVLIIVVK